MNYVTSYKSLLLAAACAAGLTAPAFAADAPVVATAAPATEQSTHGVLGQNLANLGFSYVDLHNSSVNAMAYNLTLNQSIQTGIDTLFEYNYLRSEDTGAGRLIEQKVDFGGRAYTNFNGFKPFVDGGIGWFWQKKPLAIKDNSFLLFASVGAEFQAAPDLTITPAVRYWCTTKNSANDVWEFSVKANYWVTEKLAITAKISRDDNQNMGYGLGLNFRF